MTEDRGPGLWDYAAVVWRRRLAILALVVGSLLVASAAWMVRPMRYEATARYMATDADLAAEVREALRLRLFPPESIAGLEFTTTQAGRGLLVAVGGEATARQARPFLSGLPEHFRRPPPKALADPDAVPPPQPVPALPPAPLVGAPVTMWADELAEVERHLPTASEAEAPYLTARALRLRDMLEQARRDALAAVVARERHRQEVSREQEQYARQLAVATERRRVGVPSARELTMVHPPVLTTVFRSWGQTFGAAVVGALVVGVLGALVAEWYQQERARRAALRG